MTSTPAFVRSPGPLREGLNAGFQENADLSSLAQGSGLLDESVMPFGFMEPSVDSLPFPVLTASQQLATEVKSGPQKVGWKARIGLGVEGSGSEDAEVNLDEYGPQARANRSWRHGILSCLSTEDGAGIGASACSSLLAPVYPLCAC